MQLATALRRKYSPATSYSTICGRSPTAPISLAKVPRRFQSWGTHLLITTMSLGNCFTAAMTPSNSRGYQTKVLTISVLLYLLHLLCKRLTSLSRRSEEHTSELQSLRH